MRVKEFENAILEKGFKPKEVRLEKNHVKWFICAGNQDNEIIVFDSHGTAFMLPSFCWPSEVNDIRIEVYRYKNGPIIGMTINGVTAQRDSRLDLHLIHHKWR